MMSIRICLFAILLSMALTSDVKQASKQAHAPAQPAHAAAQPAQAQPQQVVKVVQQGKPEVIVIEKDIIDTEDGNGDGNEEIIEKRNGQVVSDKVCPVHHDHPDYKHCHKKAQAAQAAHALAQKPDGEHQKPVRMLAQKFKQ